MSLRGVPPEHALMLAVLLLYPVFALVVRSSMSAMLFAIGVLSIFHLVRSGALWRRSTWDTASIAFAAVVASSMLAIILSQFYHGNFTWRSYDEAARLLLAVPICLAIRAADLKPTRILEYAFPAGAITAFVLVGLDPRRTGDERLTSHFLNVVHFGDLALILGFLSLASIDAGHRRTPWLLVFKLAGLFAGLYLSFRSGTRGGWLAIPVLCAIWVLSQRAVRSRMAGGLLAVMGVAVYVQFDVLALRLGEFSGDLAEFDSGNRDTSLGIRLQIFDAAFYMLRENLLFGVTIEGYRRTLYLLSGYGLITPLAAEFGMAETHNQLLSYTVKYGIFGFASGLAVCLVPLAAFARGLRGATGETRVAAVMGLTLVSGFMVFGCTVEIFNLKTSVSFYSLTLAALAAAARPLTGTPRQPP